MEEVDGVIYKTELDKYLREEPDDTLDPKFNVLDWWKLNSHRYPILSQMARDVLAVPISTVSSESAFSTGGRVLDAFRSSLTPRIVEALICNQDWLRADSRAPSIEEDQLDIDKIDEELSKVLRTIGISDISLPHDHSTPSSCVGANGCGRRRWLDSASNLYGLGIAMVSYQTSYRPCGVFSELVMIDRLLVVNG
ncbi:Zinc finger BED domain-containing protein RICESLEEPER 2 [Linum perenne]